MKIRFIRLTPEALSLRSLLPETPVAIFDAEGAGECIVLAAHVNPFSDIDFLYWSARPRELLLQALCAEARHAEWQDQRLRRLALHRRFVVEPNKDEPAWLLQGFTSIQNVDLHLIKHVLGVGVSDADDTARWAELLGTPIQRESLLGQLEALGCVEWKRLEEEPEPETERPISLYRKLSVLARASCIRLLATLRERYMELACHAVGATASLQNARHIHLGVEHRSTMHFLDGKGMTVIAKGERMNLAISTAFSALAGGEDSLGPATLRKRWARIINDPDALSGNMKVHSPLTWRMTT
jgi:hypothetical protein